MNLVLQPGNSFTVVRQISNHLDTDTNYVQAVIRNAYTDAIIDTLQLTDKGSQRFSKNWQVPADPSGQGFYISIVTSVYTDSGYTTKNGNYGDDENTYLIQDRVMRLGGGGGVDAYTVRRIVSEEIAKIPAPEPVKIPKAKEYQMRWDDVLGALERLQRAVKAIPTETKDDAPVLAALEDVKQAIASKEVTPATDLDPVLSKLDEIATDATPEVRHQDVTAQVNALSELVQALPEQISTVLEQIELQVGPMKGKPTKVQPEPVPFDITKFAT